MRGNRGRRPLEAGLQARFPQGDHPGSLGGAISDAVPADPLARLSACNELTLQLNIVKAGLANDTLVVTARQTAGAESAKADEQ